MKTTLLSLSLATTLSALCSHPLVWADRAAKAVVIGIDGVRPDALIVVSTPNIDRLIANGTFDPRNRILGEHYQKNDTVSGASWSSILTGVWADKHGVHDNSFEGKNYETYPHFFERLKAANSDLMTASIVSVWNPIDQHIVSGADVRHFFPLSGASTNLNVSANSIDVNTRDGNWHHLAGVRRGDMLYLYLNGQEIAFTGNRSGDFELEGQFYHFGRDARTGQTEFNGDLRGIRIWNHALAEEEIDALAADPTAADAHEPLLAIDGPLERDRRAITPQISSLTQGDYTVAVSFRTTDPGRNILMGNYGDASDGHLNLELHTENRVRLYANPQTSADRMAREMRADTFATSKAVELIRDSDPDAIWLYLHQPDAAGHSYGFSLDQPEYRKAIENFDQHVGRVVDAVRGRPSYDQEDWLFVLTTDHGGYGTGHGGGHDIPEILHGFLLVSGESVHNRISPRQSYLVDVVPTVLEHFGIEIAPDLDGHSLGLSQRGQSKFP
jgi:hypothetical protein